MFSIKHNERFAGRRSPVGILCFENLEQLTMWENEISGQLSDGHWENARPYDHWRSWHDCFWSIDPQNPGRDFYPIRERYNLKSADLLEVVGDRMRYALTCSRFQPAAVEKLLEMGVRLPQEASDWEKDKHDHQRAAVTPWLAAGLQPITGELVSLKEVRKVLDGVKRCMTTTRSAPTTGKFSAGATP